MPLFTHLLGFTFLNPSPLPPPITPTHSHKTLIKGLVITVHLLKAFFFFFFPFQIRFKRVQNFLWGDSLKQEHQALRPSCPVKRHHIQFTLCESVCVHACVCVDLSKLCCWPRRQVNLVIAFTPTSRPTKDFSWSFLPRLTPNSLSRIRLWTDTKGRLLFPLPQLQKD